MAHIFKRKDGRYSAAVSVGNSKQKHFYGKTRQEVKDKLREWEQDQTKHINTKKKTMMLCELLDEWMENDVKKHNKVRVQEERQRNIDNHLAPSLGHISLNNLSTDHIQPFINKLEKELAHNTVRNIRADLRRALNYAMERRYKDYNPAALVKLKKSEPYQAPVWTLEEALQFERAIVDHRWSLLFKLEIRTGMRQSEILGLLIDNLDFDKQTIKIAGTLQWQAGKLERTTTKNKASVGTLSMPPTLAKPLREHVAQLKIKFPDNRYLFVTDNGTPISRHNLWREFKDILKDAGLPDIPFHSLRHTCASLLLQEGENVKMVQQQLRHKHITTTLQIYAHIIPDDERRASANLDNLLSENHDAE